MICLLQIMNKLQKYLVGTLFDQEQQDKKTNIHNMKAKDPFGNTRWKGAFTGGFEAGYKNTCGSKEGWVPSTFVSSVYKKADKTERTIFDYMDKQDLGRQSISQNIVLNNNFESRRSEGYNITIQESIGQKILNKLKKIQAHRTAPQNMEQLSKLFDLYAQQGEEQRPNYNLRDLIQPLSVGAIQNQVEPDDFIDSYEDFYKKVIRQHAKEQSEEEIKKRREQNRVYFDFTRPLEAQPDYLKEIQEIEDYQQPRKRKKNLINEQSLKSIFKPAVLFKQFKKQQEIQRAPEDYDPYARMRGLKTIGEPKSQQKPRHNVLTIEKRGEKLGEVRLSDKFVSSQNSLTNKFISNQKKVQQMTKFFQDQKKNARYRQYVEQMEGRKISSQLQYMSYEQAEKERQEFEKMYRQSKEKPKIEVKPTTSHKPQHVKKQNESTFQITRKVQNWRPEKLLCKRFNVLTPYTIVKQRQQEKGQYY